MNKTFIIAEAGVNHNGSLDIAYKLIDAAKNAGVDAIKFQTFKTDKLVSKRAPKADYQNKTTDKNETQYDMIKKLELSLDYHKKIIAYCSNSGVKFLSSPFDEESVDLLEEHGIEIYKIPSGEITNLPFLRKIASKNKPIILSTGMSTLGEVETAINTIENNGNSDICILHCVTEYPAPYEQINLNAMLTLKQAFRFDVGYSDHTTGIEITLAAVAMGAKVIEKHFTIDKNMEGPDHKASLDPLELESMVRSIRNVEIAMGNGIKKPAPCELNNIAVVRKSIVASKEIKKGEVFTKDNICIKRPGNGISPAIYEEIIGRTAQKNFEEDELISI